jgi:hypothetical protein
MPNRPVACLTPTTATSPSQRQPECVLHHSVSPYCGADHMRVECQNGCSYSRMGIASGGQAWVAVKCCSRGRLCAGRNHGLHVWAMTWALPRRPAARGWRLGSSTRASVYGSRYCRRSVDARCVAGAARGAARSAVRNPTRGLPNRGSCTIVTKCGHRRSSSIATAKTRRSGSFTKPHRRCSSRGHRGGRIAFARQHDRRGACARRPASSSRAAALWPGALTSRQTVTCGAK